MRTSFTLLALLSSAATVCAADASALPQPGTWEMSGQVHMVNPSGEAVLLDESVRKKCMTPEFAANSPFLQPGDPNTEDTKKAGADCKNTDVLKAPGSASWTTVCSFGNGSLLTTRISNTLETQHLTLKMDQTLTRGDAVVQRIRGVTEGRHVGECGPDAPPLKP